MWHIVVLFFVCVTGSFIGDPRLYPIGSFIGDRHRYPPNPGPPFPPRPNNDEAEPTVILTHVLFRHGNRTAQLNEIYPKDPYYNFTYFPFGRGQLTNAGKVREYDIGKALRARYNKFLGDYFYPNVVDALSTNYNRTKASLELVLASLFPPRKVTIWNWELNWQPVPYNYNPTNRDPILIGVNCPNYEKKYDELINSNKWQEQFNVDKKNFQYISKHTSLNITTYRDVYNLYFGLSTEEEWGQQLPEWTKSVWPNTIIDLAIKHYFAETASTDLLKLSIGFYLKKVIEDTKTKIQNLNEEHGRKMYLYSAHENNIADLLILLNVFNPPHVPTYGSYLIIEVHNIRNTFGIKVYYQHYVSAKPVLIKLPSCDEFCPLDKFESLFEEYLPSSDDFCYQT